MHNTDAARGLHFWVSRSTAHIRPFSLGVVRSRLCGMVDGFAAAFASRKGGFSRGLGSGNAPFGSGWSGGRRLVKFSSMHQTFSTYSSDSGIPSAHIAIVVKSTPWTSMLSTSSAQVPTQIDQSLQPDVTWLDDGDMNSACNFPRRRKRAILTAQHAYEIYLFKQFSFFSGLENEMEQPAFASVDSVAISRIYGISPKAVRDIWNRLFCHLMMIHRFFQIAF